MVTLPLDPTGTVQNLETVLFEGDNLEHVRLKLPEVFLRTLTLRVVCVFEYKDVQELPNVGAQMFRSVWTLGDGGRTNADMATTATVVARAIGDETVEFWVPGLWTRIEGMLRAIARAPNLRILSLAGVDFGRDTRYTTGKRVADAVSRGRSGSMSSYDSDEWEAGESGLAGVLSRKLGFAWTGGAALESIGILCPHLEVLDLSLCPRLPARSLGPLLELLPNLRRLYLKGCVCVTDDVLEVIVKKGRRLEVLDLGGNPLTPKGVSRWLGSSGGGRLLPELRELSLMACEEVGEAAVLPVLETHNLEALNLGSFRKATPVLTRKIAETQTRLRFLSLRSCELLPDAEVAAMVRRVGATLEELDLIGVYATSVQTAEAVAQSCPNLRQLTLGGAEMLPDASMAKVVRSCPRLEVLSAWWCSLCGDETMEALGELEGIRDLDLTRWGVTDGGLKRMCDGLASRGVCLERVVITGCDGISVLPSTLAPVPTVVADWDTLISPPASLTMISNASGTTAGVDAERWARAQPFLAEGSKGSEPLRRFKLMLVGAGRSGKTQLRLTLRCFPEKASRVENTTEGRTRGIETETLQLPWREDEPLVAKCLDFGGQASYLASHAFFLSGRCLYLLVLDVTRDEETLRHEACRWLAAVQARSPGSPILVIGSHADAFPSSAGRRPLGETATASASGSGFLSKILSTRTPDTSSSASSSLPPFDLAPGTARLRAAVSAMEERSRRERRQLTELAQACDARADKAAATQARTAVGMAAWREARAWRSAGERAARLAQRRCRAVGAVLVDSLEGRCVVLRTEKQRGWAWPLPERDRRIHPDSDMGSFHDLRRTIANVAHDEITLGEHHAPSSSSPEKPEKPEKMVSSSVGVPQLLLDQSIPRSWSTLAQALDEQQGKGSRSTWPAFRAGVCSWREFARLSSDFVGGDAPTTSSRAAQSRLEAAVRLLDDLGLVVYFDGALGARARPAEDGERRQTAAVDVGRKAEPIVILRPQLLVDAVKAVIGHRYVGGGGAGDGQSGGRTLAVQRDDATDGLVWEVLDEEGEATGERVDAAEAGVTSASELRELRTYLTTGVLTGARLRQWWRDVVPPKLAPSFVALLEGMHVLVPLDPDDDAAQTTPSAAGAEMPDVRDSGVHRGELWEAPPRIFCPLVLGQVVGGGVSSCGYLSEPPFGWDPVRPSLGGPVAAVARRRFRFIGGLPNSVFPRIQALLSQLGVAPRRGAAPFGPWWACVRDRKPLRVAPELNCALDGSGAAEADRAGLREWPLAGQETVLVVRRRADAQSDVADALAADCVDVIAWYNPPPPAAVSAQVVETAQKAVLKDAALAPQSWADLPSSRQETTTPWRIFSRTCHALRTLAQGEFAGAALIEAIPILKRTLQEESSAPTSTTATPPSAMGQKLPECVFSIIQTLPEAQELALGGARDEDDAMQRSMAGGLDKKDEAGHGLYVDPDLEEDGEEGVDWSMSEIRETFQRALASVATSELGRPPPPPLAEIAASAGIEAQTVAVEMEQEEERKRDDTSRSSGRSRDRDRDRDRDSGRGRGASSMGQSGAGASLPSSLSGGGASLSDGIPDGIRDAALQFARQARDRMARARDAAATVSVDVDTSTIRNPMGSHDVEVSSGTKQAAGVAAVGAAGFAAGAAVGSSRKSKKDASDTDNEEQEAAAAMSSESDPDDKTVTYTDTAWAVQEATRLWALAHSRVLLPPAPGEAASLPASILIPPSEYSSAEDAAELLRIVMERATVRIPHEDLVDAAERAQDGAAGFPWGGHLRRDREDYERMQSDKNKDPETFCEATRRGALTAWMRIIPIIAVAIVSGILIPFLLGAF